MSEAPDQSVAPVKEKKKEKKKEKEGKKKEEKEMKRKDRDEKDKKKDKDDKKKDGKDELSKKDKEAKRKEKEEKKKEKEAAKAREREEERMSKKSKRKSWMQRGPLADQIAQEGAAAEEGLSRKDKRQSWRSKEGGSSEILKKQHNLESFLLNMPVKRLRGTTWKYYDLSPEDGFDETMVVLTSGGCRTEMMYEHILGLAREFRVISPMYPEALNEIEDYVEGLLLIMRHENVKKIHLVGVSFGAAVAQHFILCHPLRVITCTLVHPVMPCELWAGYMRKALKKLDTKLDHNTAQSVPMQRVLTGCGVRGKDIEEQNLDLDFGERELLVMMFKKFTENKTTLTARLEALLDLHSNYTYTPEKFARFSGRILLVDSEDDASFEAAMFDEICALFDKPTVHYFSGSGLMMPMVRPMRLLQLVARFLGEDESEGSTAIRSGSSHRDSDDTMKDATAVDSTGQASETNEDDESVPAAAGSPEKEEEQQAGSEGEEEGERSPEGAE